MIAKEDKFSDKRVAEEKNHRAKMLLWNYIHLLNFLPSGLHVGQIDLQKRTTGFLLHESLSPPPRHPPPPLPWLQPIPGKKKRIQRLHRINLFFVCLYPFQQINNATMLDEYIDLYFIRAASNQRVRERYGDAVLDIPAHETVQRPRETLQRLCDHLQVTCFEDYFEKCSKILYGAPLVTRNKVVWTNEQKQRVTKMMQKYPFLTGYSFAKYPS